MPLSSKSKFVDFIEHHPSCKKLNDDINQTEVIYDPDNPDESQRIRIFDIPNKSNKKSLLKKFLETIWVPGYKFRGNSYSDENFNAQLDQTSSIVSISAIFDAICTAPVLFYFTKAAGIFSLTLSLGYGWMLLIMSNKSGEYSMNRPKGNNTTASFLLGIFFLLSLVKTLVSGVGIDLVSRSEEIKNTTAKEFLKNYDSKFTNPDILYPNLLQSSSNECERLVAEQSKLDQTKRGQRKQYNQLQEKMFRNNSQLPSANPKILLDNNLSDLGPCLKKDLINNLNGQNNIEKKNIFSIQNKLKKNTPPISFLYIFQRNKFNDTFKGNPLKGSESNFEIYRKDFAKNKQDFDITCTGTKSDCNNRVSWSNPGMAINEAGKQFYSRIFNKEWDNLGLSYIGFLISILLSSTATILLYTTSLDSKNRASRSSLVEDWRNEYFAQLDEEE